MNHLDIILGIEIFSNLFRFLIFRSNHYIVNLNLMKLSIQIEKSKIFIINVVKQINSF